MQAERARTLGFLIVSKKILYTCPFIKSQAQSLVTLAHRRGREARVGRGGEPAFKLWEEAKKK